MKACTQCGKCCTQADFQGNLLATPEDTDRWIVEGRWDILKWCSLFPFGGGDLWVREDGYEKERCPFVRKDRNKPTYQCTIYDTRPQVCRNYVPFSGEDNDICEDV